MINLRETIPSKFINTSHHQHPYSNNANYTNLDQPVCYSNQQKDAAKEPNSSLYNTNKINVVFTNFKQKSEFSDN